MKIVYNDIEMQLVEMHSYERANVYTQDMADLLYVRHRLNMTCALGCGGHPEGMAAALVPDKDDRLKPKDRRGGFIGLPSHKQDNQGRLQANPLHQYFGSNPFGGEPGGATDRLLVPLLLEPRRKLKITAYRKLQNEDKPVEFTWLESPRGSLKIDAANGPHPLGCTLVEPTGEAPVSGLLNFQIETHLPLAEGDEARPLISHRWTTSVQHDEDYYATRVVSGEAVFDPSLLDKFAAHPHEFISQLYHPIPVGFRRGLPEVTLESDNSRLSYTFTDTAVPMVFDAGTSGATQCWIEEEWKYVSPMGISMSRDAIEGINGVIVNGAKNVAGLGGVAGGALWWAGYGR